MSPKVAELKKRKKKRKDKSIYEKISLEINEIHSASRGGFLFFSEMENFVPIGKISKTHSFKGELVVLLEEELAESIDHVEFLFIEIEKKPVPFYIESVRRSGGRLIVKFEDVNDEKEAKKYLQVNVYLAEQDVEALELQPETSGHHQLVGFKIIDEAHGELGKIEDILEMPMHDIALLTFKGKELLLPLNDDTIQEIIFEDRLMKYKAPEGLIEMYLE